MPQAVAAVDADGRAHADRGWQRLPVAARTYWRATTVLSSSVLVAGIIVVLIAAPVPATLAAWGAALTGVLIALAVVEGVFVVPRRHRYYGLMVDGTTVRVRRGRVVRRELQVPIAKVLYVELKDNPVTRRLGLVHVHLGTIAQGHDIGPLTPEQGRRLARAVQAPSDDEAARRAT